MTSDGRRLARDLHERLQATAETPVDPRASTWLGEAQAVAADAARPGASDEVVKTRAEQVLTLLDDVDETGNPEADEQVAAARAIAAAILRRT